MPCDAPVFECPKKEKKGNDSIRTTTPQHQETQRIAQSVPAPLAQPSSLIPVPITIHPLHPTQATPGLTSSAAPRTNETVFPHGHTNNTKSGRLLGDGAQLAPVAAADAAAAAQAEGAARAHRRRAGAGAEGDVRNVVLA